MNLVAPVADLTCDIKKEAGAIRSLGSLADLQEAAGFGLKGPSSQVKVAALECMTAICSCTGNKDGIGAEQIFGETRAILVACRTWSPSSQQWWMRPPPSTRRTLAWRSWRDVPCLLCEPLS